jgi:hypothetical protein
MALKLGKQFNRNYHIRLPFLNGFYNIGVYFNKKSAFLLFSVDSELPYNNGIVNNKINMFKNLESSSFCETFLELHNYRKSTLDIVNQFKDIKPEYSGELSFILNESISLSRININDRDIYDKLNIYGLTINTHINEFIFVIVERHHIIKRFNKKVVRTSGIQISTLSALEMLKDYHQESRIAGKVGMGIRYGASDKIIKLSDVDKELEDN